MCKTFGQLEVAKKNYPHVSESDVRLEAALRTLARTYHKSWIAWLEKQGEKVNRQLKRIEEE